MSLAAKVNQLGLLFVNRLGPEVAADAVEYAEFSECRIAVEMLCDQLFEYNAPISAAEFERLREVAEEAGADMDRIESLRPFVTIVDPTPRDC